MLYRKKGFQWHSDPPCDRRNEATSNAVQGTRARGTPLSSFNTGRIRTRRVILYSIKVPSPGQPPLVPISDVTVAQPTGKLQLNYGNACIARNFLCSLRYRHRPSPSNQTECNYRISALPYYSTGKDIFGWALAGHFRTSATLSLIDLSNLYLR